VNTAGAPPMASGDDGIGYASAVGRWVLLATVLGSAMASIDATVVGIAPPAAAEAPFQFHCGLDAPPPPASVAALRPASAPRS